MLLAKGKRARLRVRLRRERQRREEEWQPAAHVRRVRSNEGNLGAERAARVSPRQLTTETRAVHRLLVRVMNASSVARTIFVHHTTI